MSDSEHPGDESAPSDGIPLRAVRAERLLSIRELAGLAEVAPSTIYMIETGRSTPRPAIARLIARALGVAPQDVAEFRRTILRHGGGAGA